MPRSRTHAGAPWLEALRAFSTFRKQLQNPALSVSAASSVAAPSVVTPYPDGRNRIEMYEQVAQAQLFGPPGYRVSAENLRVLRAARWELLKIGSPRNKSLLLERILQLYTEASKALFYDSVPSQAERQSLLLEQMQCLVEARVSGIPLTARHYRHPLQAPQLSEIGADLPLVLLQELEMAERRDGGEERQERVGRPQRRPTSAAAAPPLTTSDAACREQDLSDTRELTAARLDCAVGLASSGYIEAALRLCTADGFPYVIRQVAQMKRDGWRQAWALADAVPLRYLLPSSEGTEPVKSGRPTLKNRTQREHEPRAAAAPSTASGWLNGVLDAAVRKYKASGDPAVREWVFSFMRVWTQDRARSLHVPAGGWAGAAAGGAGTGAAAADRAARSVPVRVVETYLAVCPASSWREALEVVMCFNTTGSPFPTSEHLEEPDQPGTGSRASAKGEHGTAEGEVVDEGGTDQPKVAMGRLMALLNVAQQPLEILRLFYGSLFTPDSLVNEDAGVVEPATIWCPSDEFLSPSDMQHPATYNHAMMALAQLGHWRRAMLFYKHLPESCTNRYTHWTAVRMLIQPQTASSSSPSSSPSLTADAQQTPPPFLLDGGVYAFCLESLKRACVVEVNGEPKQEVHASETSEAAAVGTTASTTHTTVSFPDAEAVFESLALWAAAREDWRAVVWLSTHAPHGCRYIKLMALATLLRSLGDASHVATPVATPAVLRRFPAFHRCQRHPVSPQEAAVVAPAGAGTARGGDTPAAHEEEEKALEVVRQLDALLIARDASVKQVCLALAFIANSRAAVRLLARDADGKPMPSGGDDNGGEDDVESAGAGAGQLLAPEVVHAFVNVLGHHVNGSQSGLDHAIAIFMEQFFSLRQRQAKRRSHHADPSTDDDGSSHHVGVLQREKSGSHYRPSFAQPQVLAEVMHLGEGMVPNHEHGWRVALQVLAALGKSQGLSIARAAPAMVSAGMKPEVAIKFLDP